MLFCHVRCRIVAADVVVPMKTNTVAEYLVAQLILAAFL